VTSTIETESDSWFPQFGNNSFRGNARRRSRGREQWEESKVNEREARKNKDAHLYLLVLGDPGSPFRACAAGHNAPGSNLSSSPKRWPRFGLK
jgi:hypothetical protein